jgi:hypothetical protein
MRSKTGTRVALGVGLTALVGLAVWWLTRPPSAGPADGTGVGAIGRSITIRGDIEGAIVPGSMVPLNLSFANRNSFSVTVDRVAVRLRSVRAPGADAAHGCGRADFTVRQLPRTVELRLASESTQRLSAMGLSPSRWPAVGMLDRPVNQDGCKGAVLTLDYEASGLEVPR